MATLTQASTLQKKEGRILLHTRYANINSELNLHLRSDLRDTVN